MTGIEVELGPGLPLASSTMILDLIGSASQIEAK